MKTVRRVGQTGEGHSEAIDRLVHEGLATRARRTADARATALISQHADGPNA